MNTLLSTRTKPTLELTYIKPNSYTSLPRVATKCPKRGDEALGCVETRPDLHPLLQAERFKYFPIFQRAEQRDCGGLGV